MVTARHGVGWVELLSVGRICRLMFDNGATIADEKVLDNKTLTKSGGRFYFSLKMPSCGFFGKGSGQ